MAKHKQKIRQQPRIDMVYKRLVEMSDHNRSRVVCMACFRKRQAAYDKTYNRSSLDPYSGGYRVDTYQVFVKSSIAPHEKIVCEDCGAKNNNGQKSVRSYGW